MKSKHILMLIIHNSSQIHLKMSCKRCLSYVTKLLFGILMFCALVTFIIFIVGLLFPWSDVKMYKDTTQIEYTATIFNYKGCYNDTICHAQKWTTNDPLGCMVTEVLYPIGSLATIAMIMFYIIWTCKSDDNEEVKNNQTRIIISLIMLFCLIIVMASVISWRYQCHQDWINEVQAIENATIISSYLSAMVVLIETVTAVWLVVALIHLAFGKELYKHCRKNMTLTVAELELD